MKSKVQNKRKDKTPVASSSSIGSLSKPKKIIFTVLMLALPLALLIAGEILLRLYDAGENLDIFVYEETPGGSQYVLNKHFTKRYFFKKGVEAPRPRSQTFSGTREENIYRIFCLGASTTQGVPYPPKAAFPAMLKNILTTLHPDRQFEVLNCGVTAITSHSVLDMAREILEKYQPDLLVVYTGHNEFYGVFGQASRLSLFDSRAMVQLFLKMQRSRLFLSARNLYTTLLGTELPREPQKKQGTFMGVVASDVGISLDSKLFQRTERYFGENLEDIIEAAKSHQTDILICNLVDNLKDLAPFFSLPSEKFSGKQLEQLNHLLEKIQRLQTDRQNNQADSLLIRALKIDSTFAKTHYLLAKNLEAVGNFPLAKKHYLLARDLDAIRFRAPSSFNRLIQKIAADNQVPTVDVASAFAAASQGGIVGNNLILEHIHPNARGYFLIAKTIAKTMSEYRLIKPDWNWDRDKPDSIYLAMSGMTPLSHQVVNRAIYRLTSHWPFNLNSSQKANKKVAATRTETLAENFVKGNGGSLIELHLNYGLELFKQGKMEEALAEYQAAQSIETTCEAFNLIGLLYARKTEMSNWESRGTKLALQHYRLSLESYQQGLSICPQNTELLYNQGNLYSMIKLQYPKAIANFQKILELDPGHQNASKKLIKVYLLQGQYQTAKKHLMQAIKQYDPDETFYSGLGLVYYTEGNFSESEVWLKKALKVKPRDKKTISFLKEVQKQLAGRKVKSIN